MIETENPFFSVVVPTYERPSDLKICLESLSYQNQVDPPNYEIIVTDDSNSDESQRMVEKEFPDVSWGKGKQNGPAGNRNAGVARAKGEWIVFLDDDCIAQEGYLAAYAAAISENPSLLVFEGRIHADRPRESLAEGAPINENGGMLWTSNLCIKKTLLDKLRGFNEVFRYAYEDVDLAYRIKIGQNDFKFVPKAAVCHPWRNNINSINNWKKKNYDIESLMLYLQIHPEEYKNFTPHLLIRKICRSIVRTTIPGLLKYKGKGFFFAISSHIKTLKTIYIIEKNKKKIKSIRRS